MKRPLSTSGAVVCAVPSLMLLVGAGCVGMEDEGAPVPAAGESIAPSQSSLVGCQWGAGSYVRVGDYNGDGKKDVLSMNGGSVDAYRGFGPPAPQFTFGAFTVDNTWGGPEFTFTGNFTGAAGSPFTQIASANGGNVFMKLPGPPGFAWTSTAWPVPNSWGGAGFTWAADFTGDGTTDIATAIGGTINLFRSTRSSFAVTSSAVPNLWGGAAFTFAADFTGDGKADIASASGTSVYMKISNGSGFTPATWTGIGGWGGAGFAFAADFNGDGKADIASASGGSVFMKLSTGSAFTPATWSGAGGWGSADYTFAADFNGDGKADIASASGGNVFLRLSTGSGFTAVTAPVSLLWGGPGFVKAGDFTGDGKADIASFNGCAATLLESTGTAFVAHTS